MNVWIFNHYASPPDRSAGTRHYELARLLAARGHRPTIFAAGFSHTTLKEERLRGMALFKTGYHNGVRFVWLRTPPYKGNGLTRLLNMLTYAVAAIVVQLRFSRPDVVIGSSVHPFAALAGYCAARLRGAKFSYEIRDLWPQTLVDMGALSHRSILALALWRLESLLTKRADVVIGLLPGLADYFRERSLVPKRLVYIPNGARVRTDGQSLEMPPRVAQQIRAWRSDGRVIVGYVGAHGLANGLETVVEAAAILSAKDAPVGLVLVGDGSERGRLNERIAQLQLENIRLLGSVPKTAVPAVLAGLDIGLFHLMQNPVFRFGISANKLWDYFAHELPVVFACTAAYNPVALADAGMTVEPDSPQAMADALLKLIRVGAAERAAMGARGRQYLEAEHDLDKLATRLEKTLTATVTGTDGAPGEEE